MNAVKPVADLPDIAALRRRAWNMRRHMLAMARGPGQGYAGQGLAIADALAALYFHEMRWNPQDLTAKGRDRFVLSTGHYSIALWAALAEAGVFPLAELSTYGADDSRLAMARGPGQGYVGQGLAIADALAALYFHEMRWNPQDLTAKGRDRFVLSTGHYSIALWAALAEAGVFPLAELSTYGADDSRLAMSTVDTTPGVEMIGGSLGHGLGQSIGMALGERMNGSGARIYCELSDGEMQEGSTWEGAMSASHFELDNLVALVDCNGIQADGPLVLDMEPVAEKWRAFGWVTQEVNGNDMASVVDALAAARHRDGKPHAIVLRTTPGHGVPSLVAREKSHFIRVDPGEWDALQAELERADP